MFTPLLNRGDSQPYHQNVRASDEIIFNYAISQFYSQSSFVRDLKRKYEQNLFILVTFDPSRGFDLWVIIDKTNFVNFNAGFNITFSGFSHSLGKKQVNRFEGHF